MAGNQITSFRNNVYTIYAHTNLDTSFALVVTDEDTVKDAKHKAVIAHRICFPHIGDITIQSFKVKLKGCFFYLPDPMLVTSAFVGVKNTWYLYVDASCSPTRTTQNLLCLEAGANIQPEVLCVGNEPLAEAERNKIGVLQGSGYLVNELVPVLSPNIVGCGMNSVELEKSELANEQNEVLNANPKSKEKKSKKRKKDTLQDDVPGEDLQLEPIAKKSRSTMATLEGDNPGICMVNENASHLENVAQENSLKGVKATTYAKLDGGMPIKHMKDSKSKEKDSLILEEKVDSTLVPSRENARDENSKEQAANINDDLVLDTALTISSKQMLENLGVMEKEIQYREVEEVGDGNPIPYPSLGKSHAKPAVVEAVGDVGVDSPQDVDMGGAFGSELRSRVDNSEKIVAVGVSKRKKSKKDQVAIANEAEREVKDADSSNPLDASDIRETETPGNKRRKKSKKSKSKDADTRALLHANNGDEKVAPSVPNHEKSFDGDRPAVEVDNKGSFPFETKVQNATVESHGTEIISEAGNTVSAIKDLDVPATSIEVVTEVQKDEEEKKAAPKKTRKPKLNKDSSVKPQEVIPEAGNGSGIREVSLQRPSLSTINESPQAASTVLNDVILSSDEALEVPPTKELVQKKQEKEPKLKKGRNTKAEVQNVMVESHGPEIISEAANTVLAIKDLDVPAASIEPVVTEDQDPSDKTKKKVRKTKASRVKKNVSSASAEDVEGARAVQLTSDSHKASVKEYSGAETKEGDTTLSETAVQDASTINESPQAPSTCLNNENVSRDEALEVPPNLPGNGNHEVVTPTKELVQKNQEKEPKLKKGRHTKSEVQTVMVESHGPEIITEAANTALAIKDLDAPATSIEAVVVTEAQDPSEKTKKKVRKTKASRVKKNVSSASAEDGEGARGAVQLTSDSRKASVKEYSGAETKEADIILSQTAVQDASTINESPQAPSTVLNDVNVSRDEALEVPPNLPENGNHEVLTPIEELVQKKQEKEPKLKKGRNTKAQAGDKVSLSLDDKYKAEAAAYKVSRRKTVDTSKSVKPQTLPITTPISTKVNNTGSQNRKSVLAAPKTIFSYSSTESSEDIEDTRKLDSDATMSPSDSSSSSDRSALKSRGNESYERRKMEVSGNSRRTGRNRKDLLTILSSSKSYKNAKLAASQSQTEDNETLPVQFHLDA